MTATATSPTTTKRHPIRGFLYGIVFGLGLAFIAIGQKWVALGTWPPFIIFVVGIAIGTAWSTFGPAKAPKGPDPRAGATDSAPPDLVPVPGPDPEPEAAEDAAADGGAEDSGADSGADDGGGDDGD